MGVARLFLFFPVLASLSACAYQFQKSHNPLLDLGIRKIFVPSFRNQTYRPGIEQVFTSAMVREISKSRGFELAQAQESADAVLYGTITAAESTGTGATKNFPLVQSGAGVSGSAAARSVDVASEYNATVSVSVRLVDRFGRQVFSQAITGDKVHPGSALKGDPGATAPLVNDSEQRLAMQFVAQQMISSIYQRMVDTF